MGWGGYWSLCSGLNSCTPLQGLITQVSLDILATETPGVTGAGKSSQRNVHRASAAFLRKSSHSRTFLLERIYFTSLSNMSTSIFSSESTLLTFNQRRSREEREAYVTDMLLSSNMQRWQLHEFPFGYILLSSVTFCPVSFVWWFKQCYVSILNNNKWASCFSGQKVSHLNM